MSDDLIRREHYRLDDDMDEPEDEPLCWACDRPFFALISVAGPDGHKIHPGCFTLARDKHRAELQRKAIEQMPPVGMYISKHPPQLTSYDWEARGDAEDNGPARIGPEM